MVKIDMDSIKQLSVAVARGVEVDSVGLQEHHEAEGTAGASAEMTRRGGLPPNPPRRRT